VNDKRPKKDSVEVSSRPLQDELIAIKDRLSAIETIQSISNADAVRKFIEQEKLTGRGKAILKECEEHRTRTHLKGVFGFNSDQALQHHLKPLLDADLLRQKVDHDDTIVFEWSNLFRRLPKSTIKSILGGAK
jgi:hypothetical protein